MKQQTKDKIQELRSKGKSIREIHKELGIAECLVQYYYNNDARKKRIRKAVDYFKSLPIERKKIAYSKRKDYLREYMRKRYNEDEVFRNKIKERSRLWKRKE